MNLYFVTLFDRKAPDSQVRVALWAPSRRAAFKRGLECGQVIRVELAIGTWPLLDAQTTKRVVRRSA